MTLGARAKRATYSGVKGRLRRIPAMEAVAAIEQADVAFDRDGLVPCVVQDWSTGEVLTLAYMNREALERTIESGETHFWSRSRNELWHKGETSGNVQRLRSLRYDCDADALLALVEPAGPACHTGERTCFYRTLGNPQTATHEALPALSRTLAERAEEMPAGSYTSELLKAGVARIGEKVREEAEEVVRAAAEESDQRLRAEAADVLYHVGVLLQARDLGFADALGDLTARMTTSAERPE
jgi:phosphoribosyl-AMP cyclohydrolase / phosphoribosyl-ATP pyrophosphohydrolase